MTMNKPINLPLAKAIKAGRRAYLAGKLSAQGPTPSCEYVDDSGLPCIIGAALTPADRTHLKVDQHGLAVVALIEEGIISTDAPATLGLLQDAHDKWAGAQAGSDEDEDERAEGHAKLCALLGLPAPSGAS